MSILSAPLKYTEHRVIFVPRLPGRKVMLLRTVCNLSRPFQYSLPVPFQASRSLSVRRFTARRPA